MIGLVEVCMLFACLMCFSDAVAAMSRSMDWRRARVFTMIVRQVEASQAVTQSMAKKIKLKVVIGTKPAEAESFLKLLPAFRDVDEHFDAPMLQASRKPFQTRATQRVGEVLSFWLSTMSCRMMSWCCKALNFVEMSTLGAGDCDRIGDRFLPDTTEMLARVAARKSGGRSAIWYTDIILHL